MTARKLPHETLRKRDYQSDEKQCSICRLWKPRDTRHFYVRGDSKDGLQARCKACDDSRSRHGRYDERPAAQRETEGGCILCEKLSWRVEGVRCRRCGLAHRAESKPPLSRFLYRHVDLRGLW